MVQVLPLLSVPILTTLSRGNALITDFVEQILDRTHMRNYTPRDDVTLEQDFVSLVWMFEITHS